MSQTARYLVVFATVCLTWHGLAGQDLFFRHFDFQDQYPGLRYNCLYEDRQHLVWVGTSEGLFSFDGSRFESFPIPESAQSNSVTALYQDPDGRFWIGLENGWIGQVGHDSVRTWNIEEGHPKVKITGFGNTPDGLLWISTYGEGLYFHDRQILYNINRDDGLLSNDLYAMFPVDDRIWTATDDGVQICGYANGTKTVSNLGRDQGIPDEIVKSLAATDHRVWGGTFDRGIFSVNTNTNEVKTHTESWNFGEIQKMAIYDESEVWIGTEPSGLFRYDVLRHELHHVALPLSAPLHLVDILADEEGNLWVLDRHDGIYLANRHFERVPTPVGNLQAVLVDSVFGVVVGNQDGAFRLDLTDAESSPSPVLQGVNVLSLWTDPLSRLWIGTFGQGLYVIDPTTGRTQVFDKEDGLTDASILAIGGSGNSMWLATLGGVTEVRLPANLDGEVLETKNYNLEDGLGTNYIYTCYIDRRNRVWFGTDGKGLSMLDGERIVNFSHADSIPLESVYSITEDPDGKIWFSTDGSGVFCYDGSQFTQYTLDNGIRHLEVSGLASDKYGRVILTHPEGIDLLSPENDAVLYFGSETGLSNCNPNLNAIFTDLNGTIWIACTDGLIKYLPYGKFRYTPRSTMLDVSVYLKEIPWREINTFRYNQNYLSFHFAGLWYSDPRSVSYRYMLEGLDPTWKPSREQRITYHRLPPGDYTFRLQSGFGDAFTGESELRYAFTVQKPWFKTTLFFFVIALLTGLIVYALIRFRDKRIEQAEQIKRQQVEHQLQTLQSQINPHFLFNSFNTLVSIIEDDPKVAVEYVENLSDFFRNILQYRSKNLIPLSEELDIASNFAYLLKKRFGDNLKFEKNLESTDYMIPPLTLQILLENAVKHNIISKQKPLLVEIYNEGEDYLVIKNTLQKKSIAEKSTHYGLQSIVNRFSYLSNKPVRVLESDGVFQVKIPLIKNTES